MVKILFFLLSACGCLGQAFTLQDTAFLGNSIPKVSSAALSPTNLPNATSISWWKAADVFTNGGTILTIPDAGPGGFALTNTDTTGFGWPTNGDTLNGFKTLSLVGSVYNPFQSINYTASQPHTICLIVKPLSSDAVSAYFFDTANCAKREVATRDGTSGSILAIYAGAVLSGGYLQTNIWMLLEVVFNSTSSRSWTNCIPCSAVGDAGTDASYGLTLGASCTGSGSPGTFMFAEGMTYSAAFTASDRNYLSNYVRGKYGAGSVVP